MSKKIKLFFYILFALFASLVNLIVQRIVLFLNDSTLFFFIALFLGTIFGLIIKYFLDKKWIFFDKTKGIKYQTSNFGKYTFMGVFSTIIFWGTETLFWLIWQNEKMREIGAIIGLSIGYIIKYKLDKRFVFNQG